MKVQKHTEALLLLLFLITLARCEEEEEEEENYDPCKHLPPGDQSEDLVLHLSNPGIEPAKLAEMRKKSRVCFPAPCERLKAYSGLIPVDDYQLLFFLHIKSQVESRKKPLLLWLQGGPGKSSLYGQFLENGPVGINGSGVLYHRQHTLLNEFNLIYLDQPVGAGYSLGKYFPGTLEEAAIHIMNFLTRFLRLFPSYQGRKFYVAGESYGARFAIAAANKIMTEYAKDIPLKLAGVMLGVGFLFPLEEIINSADYLLYSNLLDEMGHRKFNARFNTIEALVKKQNYTGAAGLLSKTVLNLRKPGEKSLFQSLTGFNIHGSIAYTKRPREFYAYFAYANSSEFKKRIHVSSSSSLDSKRRYLVMNLSMNDFFIDINALLVHVLNWSPAVLFYTAQFDDVFPAVNLENQLRKLNWRSSEQYKRACRLFWHDNSGKLQGYEKKVPGLLSATVLFGGHYIYQDRSEAVSDLYRRFLEFPPFNEVEAGGAGDGECYMMKIKK